MNRKTIKLAVHALQRQAAGLAFDANLYDENLCDTPHAQNSYNLRQEIHTAIAELEQFDKGLQGLVFCEMCKLWLPREHQHTPPV
ncbi:MAG TPA: hypothetical protein DCS05_07265 [Nitrospiraceae bacterium]|nr:hypothetical protein [Nitrospiraceae bacterium]